MYLQNPRKQNKKVQIEECLEAHDCFNQGQGKLGSNMIQVIIQKVQLVIIVTVLSVPSTKRIVSWTLL